MFNKKIKSKNSLRPIKCAICGMISDKVTSFFCGSEHAVCKECQISAGNQPVKKNAGGDSNSVSKVLNWEADYQKLKKNLNNCEDKNHFASGDHEVEEVAKKRHNKNKKSKNGGKKNNSDNFETVIEKNELISPDEATITYKNQNYCESKSSGSNSIKTSVSGKDSSTKNSSKSSNITSTSDNKTCQRPVTCPEFKCGRMIAIEHTMMHFKFDHSKLPRILLSPNNPQQFLLNSTKLTMNTRCLALMSIQKNKESVPPVLVTKPIAEESYIEIPLLLMGVRMQLEDLMAGYDRTIQLIAQEGCRQTEFRYKESFIKESKPTSLKENEHDDGLLNETFDRTEVLLLWVCKADEVASNYSIMVLSGDKKHGHSYIGETISIKEPQDPVSMYHRSECFALRGVAANRLLDDKHSILVLVTIL